MNQDLRANKQAIRAFLKTPIWTDEKLCALLAHAQDKLSMWSCCCLIGCANADHALRGRLLAEGGKRSWDPSWNHYDVAKVWLPLAMGAEEAFRFLAGPWDRQSPAADELRRKRIRPIIRRELRERERARQAFQDQAFQDQAAPVPELQQEAPVGV